MISKSVLVCEGCEAQTDYSTTELEKYHTCHDLHCDIEVCKECQTECDNCFEYFCEEHSNGNLCTSCEAEELKNG